MSDQATPRHFHLGMRCAECFRAAKDEWYAAGRKDGLEEGTSIGYEAGLDERPDPDTVRGWQADELRQVVADAHRRAGHVGRFGLCRDPMCAAIEEWLYHETRPAVREPKAAVLGRMAAG